MRVNLKPQLLSGWTEPVTCPICHEGSLVERKSRFGRFYGCDRFPNCRAILTDYELNQLLDPDYDEPYFGM